MLRSGSQLKNHLKNCRKFARKPQNVRGMSTASSSGSGRPLAIAGAVVIAGGAATLGAAWQIPSFRKTVEQNVPPVKSLFNSILGPLEDEQAKKEQFKPKPKNTKPKDVFESSLRNARKQEEKDKTGEGVQKDEIPLSSSTSESQSPLAPTDSDEKVVIQEDAGLQQQNATKVQEEAPLNLPPSPPIDEINTEEETGEIVKDSQHEAGGTSENAISSSVPQQEEVRDDSPGSTERPPEEVSENLVKLEEDVLADEAAVATILQDALASCAGQCSEAIDSNKEATKAISLHTSLLRAAMDDTKESAEEKHTQWTDLSRVLEQKSRLQNEAESLSQDAMKELSKLEAIISELKRLDSPRVMRKIIDAEENCNAMRRELVESAKDVNVKLSESHVISEYKDLIDTAKEQFRQELLSVMPDVKPESGWRKLGEKLSHDDLNALIAHAHRRVDQLQRELAEERAISTRRMEMAVQAARERWDEQAAAEMEKTVQVLKRESEIEHDKKLEEARQVFENEMRVQLKRQAAAHSEHLADMLGLQEKEIKNELGIEFQRKLEEQEQNFVSEMEKLKTKYEDELHEVGEKFQFDLNKAIAKVAGIETAVDGRAYIENESRKAQELWLACEALRIAVQYGDGGKPVPLQKELQAIAQVPGIESHILEIVNALPERASQRGVFTEEALRRAYAQVSKMCRRLSLITETQNSFFDYFLSYLKSLLIISRAKSEPPKELNPENLDTFSVLSYAAYCLEHGDLEQATRFLNQLTGESRRVAEGWLDEARLLLETKQVVDVLSSLASATNIAANLEG